MQFEYRYFGLSRVDSSASSQGLSFAPDTSREPTWFKGRIANEIAFREGISALHDVVISDQRFKPRDKSQYLAWRAQQDELDWTEIVRDRGAVLARIEELRNEVARLCVLAEGDLRSIRKLIDKHPHRIRVECDKVRLLGREVAEADHVRHMHFDRDAVTLETEDPDRCYELVSSLCLEHDIRLRSMTSPDNNLGAVFDYLTGDRR